MPASRRLKATAALVNGAAVAATLAVIGWLLPAPVVQAPPAASRLAEAAALLAWPAALVLAMVGGAILARALGQAYDPLTDPETPLYRRMQRVLTNTVEQLAVFAPALLALAAVMAPWRPGALGLLTAVWCAGRVLFWAGYLIHPYARAPGMSATLTAGAATAAWALAAS